MIGPRPTCCKGKEKNVFICKPSPFIPDDGLIAWGRKRRARSSPGISTTHHPQRRPSRRARCEAELAAQTLSDDCCHRHNPLPKYTLRRPQCHSGLSLGIDVPSPLVSRLASLQLLLVNMQLGVDLQQLVSLVPSLLPQQ